MTFAAVAEGTAPVVHLDPSSGVAGSTIAATASGFSPGEFLHLSVVGVDGAVVRSSGLADRAGAVTIVVAIPSVPAPTPGSYGFLVTATAAAYRRATADFNLTAPAASDLPATPVIARSLVLPEPVVARAADVSSPAPAEPAAPGSPEPMVARAADVSSPAPAEPAAPGSPEPVVARTPDLASPAPAEAVPHVLPAPGAAALTAGVVGAAPDEAAPFICIAADDPAQAAPPDVQPVPTDRSLPPPPTVRPLPRPAPLPPVAHPLPVGPSARPPRPGRPAPESRSPRPRRPQSAPRRPQSAPRPTPIGDRHRVLVGVVLATVVFGGGLLGASGLPSTSLPASLAGEPALAAGTKAVVARSTLVAGAPADELGNGTAVTLAFGGDVHFEGVLAKRLAANPRTVLDAARPLFAGSDIAMVNLETAVTSGGAPQSKQFAFRAPSSAFTALKAAGITVATQANNHGEDYGPVGLIDSIEAAKRAGFPVIGIGNNLTEALTPYRATVRGQRIDIIAATQVLDDNLQQAWTATDSHPGLASAYDTAHLLAAVRNARATSDTVVVYLHWGTELQSCPNRLQQPLAGQLVEAGADIVVGTHAHVQLGGGRLGHALVDYGLGNFAFYATAEAQLASGVLKVTVTGRRIDSYKWVPARITDGVPRPLSGSAATSAETAWARQRSCTDLAL